MAGNFFIFKRESVYDIAFRLVFRDTLKMVVSRNNECYFEVLRTSSNFDYLPQRYRGNKIIKAVTGNESN